MATGILNQAIPDVSLAGTQPAQTTTTPRAASTNPDDGLDQPGQGGASGMLTDWYKSYMNSQPQTQGYNAAQAGATDWSPDKNATVQGQLAGILDAGSPLMDRAKTQALQGMNARGLLNSSLAVGAGQSALYDAAMPIAQQDADTFSRAGQFNAGAKNTAALTNAGFTNDASRFGATAQNDAVSQQREAGIGSEQLAQQTASQSALQRQQQDFTAGQNTLDRTQQSTILTAQQNFQGAQAELDRAMQVARDDKSIAAQQALQEAQQKFQGAQSELDRAQQSSLQTSQYEAQAKQLAQQHANTLEQMGYQSKLATAQVPATFAANISATTMQQVGVIMADPNLDEAGKKNALDNVVNYANAQLSWAEKFYGTTIAPISLPGAPAATAPAAPTAPTAPAAAPAPAPVAAPVWDPGDMFANPGGA